MTVTTITPPASLPVTLAQMKQHLRIDHDADDTYLTELADAATRHVEATSGHALIDRTLRQYVDQSDVNNRCVQISAWPVRAIVAVTAYDRLGDPLLLDAADSSLKLQGGKACIFFDAGVSAIDMTNGLEVDFLAGHGESGIDVPANIIRAILVLIAHWYEFRGVMTAGDASGLIPQGLDRLLAPVRRMVV